MKYSHMALIGFFLLCSIALIILLPIPAAIAQDMAPHPLTPANGTHIHCDPHTGRPQQQAVFSWTAFDNSTEYQLQVAHNPLFNPTILDVSVPITNYEFAQLQCEQICAWRVRATKPMESQWSPIWSFVIYGGLVFEHPWNPEVLSPCNGCLNVPVQPITFSWTPFFFYSSSFREATRYKFVLSRNPAMTQIVIETDVASNSYEYNSRLDYSTDYFWRIMVPEQTYPDWSATFSFRTESAPPPPQPPPPTGISCTQTNLNSPSISSDISPFLLGAVLLGLVFASQRRPMK